MRAKKIPSTFAFSPSDFRQRTMNTETTSVDVDIDTSSKLDIERNVDHELGLDYPDEFLTPFKRYFLG